MEIVELARSTELGANGSTVQIIQETRLKEL